MGPLIVPVKDPKWTKLGLNVNNQAVMADIQTMLNWPSHPPLSNNQPALWTPGTMGLHNAVAEFWPIFRVALRFAMFFQSLVPPEEFISDPFSSPALKNQDLFTYSANIFHRVVQNAQKWSVVGGYEQLGTPWADLLVSGSQALAWGRSPLQHPLPPPLLMASLLLQLFFLPLPPWKYGSAAPACIVLFNIL